MKNKDALVRYQLINQRLRNTMRPCPTLPELVEYIQHEMDQDVSVSSVQKDIYHMRHNAQLGYFAPIVFDYHKYGYKYSDPEFTISVQELLEQIQSLKQKIKR